MKVTPNYILLPECWMNNQTFLCLMGRVHIQTHICTHKHMHTYMVCICTLHACMCIHTSIFRRARSGVISKLRSWPPTLAIKEVRLFHIICDIDSQCVGSRQAADTYTCRSIRRVTHFLLVLTIKLKEPFSDSTSSLFFYHKYLFLPNISLVNLFISSNNRHILKFFCY